MLASVAAGQVREDLADRASLLSDASDRSCSALDESGAAARISGIIQARFDANLRSQDAAQSVDDFESGFEMRRVRIKLDGHVPIEDSDDRVIYEIETQFSRSTGNLQVFDAYAGYETERFRLRVGQLVAPLIRESLIVLAKRQALDLSPTSTIFGLAGPAFRSQGVEGRWREGDWWFSGMVNDGSRSGVTTFAGGESDVGLTARVERKFGEGWSRFADETSFRGQEPALLLGAAGHVALGEGDADGDGVQAESFVEARWTADASYEADGWSLAGAVYGLHRADQGQDHINWYGAMGRGGYFVTDDTELFSVYAWVTGEDGEGTLSVLFTGATRYIVGHTVKAQADVGYGFDRVPGVFASSSRGLLADAPGERGQVILRAQLHVTY